MFSNTHSAWIAASCSRKRLILTGWALSICLATMPSHGQEYVLGKADVLALDQPRVTFGITIESETGATLIGPQGTNTGLLDTGANGVLLVAGSYALNENYGYPIYPLDYDGNGTIDSDEQTAQYAELGVAGSTLLDVHDAQGFRILDSSGSEYLISTDLRTFGTESLNFPGLDAVVGMPTMAGRVVEMDLRSLQDPANFDFMSTVFYSDISEVAFESAGMFNVPLSIAPPEHTDPRLPESLRPTFSGLPLIEGVDLRHTKSIAGNHQTRDARDFSFLVDTGGQLSIFNEAIATELGIDFTNTLANGGDVISYVEAGGIGGTALMPVVNIDRISFPTLDGTDLILTDLQVGILDIEGAPFDAVFGMNLLTSGYLDLLLPGDSGGLVGGGEPANLEFVLDENPDLYTDAEELITDGWITISYEDLQSLINEGLVTSDTSDVVQVYTDLYNLEQELGVTSDSPAGPVFDKIVFDFTATDGTAVMRLDLNSFRQMGDVDGDGDVDEADLAMINLNFGGFGDSSEGDINGDGLINEEDLRIALNHFGEALPPDVVVPEPGAGVSLLLGLGLIARRRRQVR